MPFFLYKMSKTLCFRGVMLVAFAALGLGLLIAGTASKAGQLNPVQDPLMLSAADKTELAEESRLKAEVGDQVWPGLGNADIPIILFNDSYEYLIGEKDPPGPWKIVEGDDYQGHPYYRRAAQDPQAFAVLVGTHWAGSIGTLDSMNRKIPFKLRPDFHVVMILHELFHAFQAGQAPGRFTKANAVYKFESRYPYKDNEFAAAWNDEGTALAEALKAKDEAACVGLVRKFLEIRNARRDRATLGSDLLAFERELEWLEGLAKYAEIKFYEIAASRSREAPYGRYGAVLPFPLQWDFVRLEKTLGAQDGDLRFYLSGLAQARLLDRLSPQWKARAMQEEVYLEDLLHESVGVRSK
jgi:hypothetical protein